MTVKVGFFSVSPVYYQVPLYRRLAEDPHLDFTAIFASNAGGSRPVENGYGTPVDWGVDALKGYRSIFLRRADRNPIGGSVLRIRDLDVASLLVRERYDVLVLHGYHTLTHIAAAVTQRALGGSVVWRTENTLMSARPLWKTALKWAALRPYFHGAYGAYIGSANRAWFKRWGFSNARLFHTPYAVDNRALQDASAKFKGDQERLRGELGIKRLSEPVILTVGRLIEKKQPLHLLRAFEDVRRSRSCTLLVVGTGPLEDQMRHEVATRRVEDVVFAGFLDQTEIARAYAAADIFALVSAFDETWGLVVNEAMNFGLPVVVSDQVGCAVDLVKHRENGFVLPRSDAAALAAALGTLVDSRELRHALGQVSRSIIGAWTYDRAAKGILDTVAAAVGDDRWACAARPLTGELPSRSKAGVIATGGDRA